MAIAVGSGFHGRVITRARIDDELMRPLLLTVTQVRLSVACGRNTNQSVTPQVDEMDTMN